MNFKRYHVSKNILNNIAQSTSRSNVTITVNADKTITLNGTLINTDTYITLGYIDFIEGEKYTISGVTGFTDSTLQIFVGSNSAFPAGNRLQCYNGAVTRTARASERCEVRLYMYNTVTYNNVIVSPQINEGSTPLPYEPYSSEVWRDIPHYIYNTSTDTITTLPADLYPNDTTATVKLKGNMVQNGTPSPQNPITPSECGERTGNLLASLTENYVIDASGNINSNNFFMYYTAPCEANETYTFSLDSGLSGNTVRIHAFNGDTWIEQLSGRNINFAPFTVTTPANTTNLKISITKDAKTYSTMLNVGETALPYEPYGYKIPISSANTTTPVYLGEVETTRKIKKLVLTDEESWAYYGTFGTYNHKHFYIDLGGFTTIPMTNDILLCCNTYTATNNVNNIDNYCCRYQQTGNDNWNINRIYFTNDDYNSLDDVITALRNNPIILYIIAAQETTGIVNEPIRKIGNYADTVSGITIPTTAGADSFDVLTTLKPSDVELAYTGWHDASVKEWDGSDWN